MPSGIVTEEVLDNIEKAKQPLVKIYHYHVNHLGTPQELSDEKGDIVWLSYDRAWGGSFDTIYEPQFIDNWAISESELQPIKFQGQSLDVETGLHYNRFRYYDSDVGMFISRDPIGLLGGNNVFQYAPNPVMWIDPWGLVKDEEIVYQLLKGDEIVYYGITERSALERFNEHLRSDEKKGKFDRMEVIAENLRHDEARTIEGALIRSRMTGNLLDESIEAQLREAGLLNKNRGRVPENWNVVPEEIRGKPTAVLTLSLIHI